MGLHIGIAGAGLAGRLLAWQLAAAGHRVSVFDPAPSALPHFADSHPATPQAAGFTAAGMLSPIAELDNAEPAIAALGWRSIALWQHYAAALPLPAAALQVQGSLLLAHRGDDGAAQRVLDRIHAAEQHPAWQSSLPAHSSGLAGVQKLSREALAALEPRVQGAAHAWLLGGEGAIDPVAALAALYQAASAHGAQWHWGKSASQINPDGSMQLADASVAAFDYAIDARGVGANHAVQSEQNMAIRGVRGETVWLHAPAHGLRRPVRLLHPRYRVYIVPRTADTILIGASEIESQDYSPVSLRTAVELMTAAHSVLPELAEARIMRLDSNCRPATPDNNPVVAWQSQRLSINGLFRHGWLLAPALVEQALHTAPFAA
jgi:glycine oxidase